MIDCAPVATPMEEGIRLYKDMEADIIDTEHYQSKVGSLIFFMNIKPDIAYAVSCVSRYMAAHNGRILRQQGELSDMQRAQWARKPFSQTTQHRFE